MLLHAEISQEQAHYRSPKSLYELRSQKLLLQDLYSTQEVWLCVGTISEYSELLKIGKWSRLDL